MSPVATALAMLMAPVVANAQHPPQLEPLACCDMTGGGQWAPIDCVVHDPAGELLGCELLLNHARQAGGQQLAVATVCTGVYACVMETFPHTTYVLEACSAVLFCSTFEE